jgi:myo-inositol 2-dehydrogenase/D-chiro-inositol 1-dehydrogenase
MLRYGAQGTETGAPYEFFFTERYGAAFAAQIGAFVDAVKAGHPPEVGFEDGMRALALAEAAYLSLREGRMVRVDEVP